jgi:hypothetical protein
MWEQREVNLVSGIKKSYGPNSIHCLLMMNCQIGDVERTCVLGWIYRRNWHIRCTLISKFVPPSSLKFWWCTIVKVHLISGGILYARCILYANFYGTCA